jgi:hypothetical protein
MPDLHRVAAEAKFRARPADHRQTPALRNVGDAAGGLEMAVGVR